MEKDIAELKSNMKNKVEYSLFDEEIQNLKNLINSLSSSGNEIKVPIVTGPSISSKELNEIREAIQKISQLEAKLNKLDID